MNAPERTKTLSFCSYFNAPLRIIAVFNAPWLCRMLKLIWIVLYMPQRRNAKVRAAIIIWDVYNACYI